MAGLKVLSALDTARTQYYHFKAIIIAGMGLFTDAYDLFCIPPIMSLLGRIYYKDRPRQETPPEIVSAMVAVALLGTVIGQLVFGRMGDRVGRRRVYGVALMLMVLCSLACGFSICTTKGCVLGSLALFRFLLGIGIGGDYPLSATIMSEFANKRTRGAFIAAVFSMQGIGILVSSTVAMVVCAIFDGASNKSPKDPTPGGADIAWRLILMLGAIPAAMTYYWRMMMPETARYTALVQQNVLQAARDMEKVLDVQMSQIAEEYPLPPASPPYPLLSKQFFEEHGRDLFACAANWFLVDVVFYSSNLFQSQIYKQYLKPDSEVNAYRNAFNIARLQAIIAVCSTIPGYWFTVYSIDRVGRVGIQMMGFCFMALVYLAIGIPYHLYWEDHTNTGFMVLYALTFFFSNFGPNTTTFIVPAELFPARFRSTCHGISGAAGKVGAIIGSVGFLWASHNRKENGYPEGVGMTASLVILGGVCIVGALVTYFFTRETMGRSLEENENTTSSSNENYEAAC
ncbi:Phosphate transporter [Quillaja saponaria]|uniref:Phosphate transporter n=1 Tax=Quillaja saponaria TaxID=32244 RepID=A0AAD7PT64_QUISA|nr:Phosphate transporter [Quillaja saponaria]